MDEKDYLKEALIVIRGLYFSMEVVGSAELKTKGKENNGKKFLIDRSNLNFFFLGQSPNRYPLPKTLEEALSFIPAMHNIFCPSCTPPKKNCRE